MISGQGRRCLASTLNRGDLYRARPFSWTRISVISVSSEGPSRFVDSCDMWYKLFCFWKEKKVTWQTIPTIVYRFSVWEFLNPITFSAAWVKLITTYTFVFWTLQKKKKNLKKTQLSFVIANWLAKDQLFFCCNVHIHVVHYFTIHM